MKIIVVRDCPKCDKFLESHPTLRIKNIINQRMGKEGWYHTSERGRMLHRYVEKHNG